MMKKNRFLPLSAVTLTMVLAMLLLLGAGAPGPRAAFAQGDPTETPGSVVILRPGSAVDGMTLAIADATRVSALNYPTLINYCVPQDPTNLPTNTRSSVCDILLSPELLLDVAEWFGADPETLTESWRAIAWSITIDGQPVDLDEFGTVDYESQRSGLPGAAPDDLTPVANRIYPLLLTDLQPGTHTVVVEYTLKDTINDGILQTAAGDYTDIFELNIGRDFYSRPCPEIEPVERPDATPPPTDAQGYLGILYVLSPCGMFVQGVTVDTPAQQAGILAGDVVLAIDGVVLDSQQVILSQILTLREDVPAIVSIARDTDVFNVEILPVARPTSLPPIQSTPTPR